MLTLAIGKVLRLIRSMYISYRYRQYLTDFYESGTEYDEILYISKFSVCFKYDEQYDYYSRYADKDCLGRVTLYAFSVDTYIQNKIYVWALRNIVALSEIRTRILNYLYC